MIVRQLSVFLENKPGRLAALIDELGKNNIDLYALSVAETQDYGLLRIIVDKPTETAQLLCEADWLCSVTNVLAVTVPDEPGSLRRILSTLAAAQISLEYTYAFLSRNQGSACIVLRVEDNEQAQKVLRDAGIEC